MHFGCETEFPRAGREFFLNIKNDNRVEFAIFGNHKYLDMFMKDDKNETVDSLNKKYNEIKDIGTHTKKDLKNYYILSKDALKSGMFSYFAHPDL
jgi:hypothetical protein